MATDTSEKGLESLIVEAMTGVPGGVDATQAGAHKPPTPQGGTGWLLGNAQHYDREHALDRYQLLSFQQTTQEAVFEALGLGADGPPRLKFFARLQGEIAKRGVIDVLRKGVQHNQHHVTLFYGTPTPGNTKAEARYAQNR
ncbi:MAG: type I restriction endonuclease subunit R, partial [Burkholderiales bacterium]